MPKMIPDPEGAFRRFVRPRDALLLALEEEAGKEGIPIIGPVVGQFLHILARAMQAKQILELGTATGYSAIYLARACQSLKGKLVTLEKDEGMAKRAQASFQKAGLEHCIEIRVGDALAEVTNMKGPFDLIFLDIDKEGYLPLLSHSTVSSKPEVSWSRTMWDFKQPRISTVPCLKAPGGKACTCFLFSPIIVLRKMGCAWRFVPEPQYTTKIEPMRPLFRACFALPRMRFLQVGRREGGGSLAPSRTLRNRARSALSLLRRSFMASCFSGGANRT